MARPEALWQFGARRVPSPIILLAAFFCSCLVFYLLANPAAVFASYSGGGAVEIGEAAVGAETVLMAESENSSVARRPDFYLKPLSAQENENLTLERVLGNAAMEDRTVILTTLNKAWASPGSIMDLFLHSFAIGNETRRLVNHLVIVAMDHKAYSRCLSIHPHCFALETQGVDFSREKSFRTPDYLKMMWRRIDFLRSVLEIGYNFIFTDADIMWFRDPFPHFHPDADFQIACDHFIGSPTDLQNKPNGGFNYVKSNNRTINLYKFWYHAREAHPGYHDQDVLNFIKYDPFIGETGVQMRFLDTLHFGGLCEPSKDFHEVCTMHANCCAGLDKKIHVLKIMLEDWRRFLSLPPSRKDSSFWRLPRNCRYLKLRRTFPVFW